MPRILQSHDQPPVDLTSSTSAPPSIEVPGAFTISVFTRHSEGCTYHGDPNAKRCDCWKSLYIREGKKTRYLSAKTRSWAQAEKLAEAERKKRDPNEIERQRLVDERAALERQRALQEAPLVDALDQWVKGHKEIREDSLEAYRSTSRRLLRWAEWEGVNQVSHVTYPLLHKWYSSWAPDAKQKQDRLSLNSQRTLLIRLKAFFSWATAMRMTPEDPTALLKSIGIQDGQTWPLTPKQFEEVIAATYHIDKEATSRPRWARRCGPSWLGAALDGTADRRRGHPSPLGSGWQALLPDHPEDRRGYGLRAARLRSWSVACTSKA